jgi:hypothetical protein
MRERFTYKIERAISSRLGASDLLVVSARLGVPAKSKYASTTCGRAWVSGASAGMGERLRGGNAGVDGATCDGLEATGVLGLGDEGSSERRA